jgi:hypothetical protein
VRSVSFDGQRSNGNRSDSDSPNERGCSSTSLLRLQNMSQYHVRLLGVLSISACSSSRRSKYARASSAISSNEKLKCPQLAATSSRSARTSTGRGPLIDLDLYSNSSALLRESVYSSIADRRCVAKRSSKATVPLRANCNSSSICFRVKTSDLAGGPSWSMNITNISAGASKSLPGVLVPLLATFHAMSWKDTRDREGVLDPSHVLLPLEARPSESSESSLMTSRRTERDTEPLRDFAGDEVPVDQVKGIRSVSMFWSSALRRMENCVDAALRRPPMFCESRFKHLTSFASICHCLSEPSK